MSQISFPLLRFKTLKIQRLLFSQTKTSSCLMCLLRVLCTQAVFLHM